MGYYTNFEVEITGFKDKEELDLFEFKRIYKSGKFYKEYFRVNGDEITAYLDSFKWYEWEKDILQLLEGYPHLTCIIHGEREEYPDIWKAKIKDGKCQKVKAEITFPPFDEV